ncbi:hypothetical protein RB653_006879 [Dictyostelium firmibasis]|uniref:Uncharacterized protein n=1 Tax=Dictyostelium firmibasis TaxID=79012 RepID=A0AAN7U0A5_9MYCE
MINYNKLKKVRAIIFDLDGTLLTGTDFKLLKKELNLQDKVDVLQVINSYSNEDRERANRIIYEFELKARNQIKLQDNVEELLEFLENNNIPKAIHSRNSLENIRHFVDIRLSKPYTFHHLVGREIEPPKPNPSGSFDILRVFNESFSLQNQPIIKPEEILFVGDSIDDIHTSNNFGSISMLLLNDHNKHHSESADYSISNLIELIEILNLSLKNNNESDNNKIISNFSN